MVCKMGLTVHSMGQGMKRKRITGGTGAVSCLGVIIAVAYIFELKNETGSLIFTFNTSTVLAVLLVAAFVLSLSVSRIFLNSSTGSVVLLWGILFCLAVLSGLWSEYPQLVLKRSLLIFAPSIVTTFLVLMDRRPRKTFYQILKFLAWFGFSLALYGLTLRFAGIFLTYKGAFLNRIFLGPFVLGQKIFGGPPLWRISSLKGNPNSLALVLLVSIWATHVQFKVKAIGRFRYYLFIFAQVVALALTFSRAGIGAAMLMYILFCIFSQKRTVSRIAGSLAAVFVLALVVLVLIPFTPQSVYSSIEERVDVGVNARDQAWKPIFNKIGEKPMGIGFAVVNEVILKPIKWEIGPHSTHLTVLSEVGLMGYTVFIVLWLYGAGLGLCPGLQKNRGSGESSITLSAGVLLLSLLFHQCFEDGLMRICALHFIWVYLIAVAAVFSSKKMGLKGDYGTDS